MSTNSFVNGFNSSTIVRVEPSHRPLTHPSNATAFFAILGHTDRSLFRLKQSFQDVDRYIQIRKSDRNIRSFNVCGATQPGGPPPSEPPSNFLNWILGVVVPILLPFFSTTWGRLLKIKSEVEATLQLTEDVVEAVEKVAEEVENAAEEYAANLPEGGKLRKAVDFVERVAERAAKDAHLVDDFIDKVQEAEEEVETFVETLTHEVNNKPPTELNDEIYKHQKLDLTHEVNNKPPTELNDEIYKHQKLE